MSDIFISYSKSDHALALKLSTFFESEGWTVWWDKSLGAADLYRDQIMKQLVAARAVITIWSPNSIRSDWVRAEAGRAKADGKLIPVKTSELTYADIPLPFGEMHTENVASTDLIRAAIVAQLAKPSAPQSPFWQITSTFKYQVLTWIGIVGSAITLFANLTGVLDLADWARELLAHWHEWNQVIWGWVFSLITVEVPKELAPIISFVVFTIILAVGVNLSARTGTVSAENAIPAIVKVGIFVLGVLVYLAGLGWVFIMAVVMIVVDPIHPGGTISGLALLAAVLIAALGVPIMYLLYFGKERLWIVIDSLLFLFISGCLLIVPLLKISGSSDDSLSTIWSLVLIFCWFALVQISWMAVILFSTPRQLARRLGFVMVGVLTLIVLSEISKLNLHQYLQRTRASDLREHMMPLHPQGARLDAPIQ